MVKLAVIADDMTGANDTGVQFAKQGWTTSVLFLNEKISGASFENDVIVMQSGSRSCGADQAYSTVRFLTEQLLQSGSRHFFKKIDSTMRGNIGQETEAMMDAAFFRAAFVVPAFPKSGRTTKHGIHYVHGVPLHQTEVAKDPACPVTESNLPLLLQQQSRRKVELIRIEKVREGTAALAALMRRHVKAVSCLVVIDAETDEDLRTIVRAGTLLAEPVLFAGSAGIAEYLFDAKKQAPDLEKESKQENKTTLPVLVVAGSVTATTGRQIEQLVQAKQTAVLIANPERFLKKEECILEINRLVQAGQQKLKSENMVLSTKRGAGAVQKVKQLQQALGITSSEAGKCIAEALGSAAGKLIESGLVSGAVLTGGDIAEAACLALGGSGMQMIGEVEPGVPLGRLIGGKHEGLPVVTKAGAFGTDQALLHAVQAIKKRDKHIQNEQTGGIAR